MKKNLKTVLLSVIGTLTIVALAAAQPNIYTWVRDVCLIKGGPAQSADATAVNLVSTSKLGQVPLNVQQRTGAGVDAFKVFAAGQYRLRVDSNGSLALNGGFGWRVNTVAGSTTSTNATTATDLATSWTITFVTGTASAARYVELPLANTLSAGTMYMVVDADANAGTNNIKVWVQSGSGNTITTTATGAGFSLIATNGGVHMFVSDGSATWKRVVWAG